MSFFTKIAVAFRAFNNADHLQAAPEGVRSLTSVPSNRIPTTHTQKDPVVYKGSVTSEDLLDLNSTYIRNAIASLGAWTSLAKGFNAFLKSPASAEVFIEEFHAWNAVTTQEAQMDEEATLAVIAKLSVVKPAKGNADTDAIIARVRKVSPEELRAEREIKAKKESVKREEAILGFSQALWSGVGSGSDEVVSISGTKAVSKAIDTMMWISQWSGQPDAIAGELLLCEADVALLERIARQETEREGESQAVFE